MYYNIVIKENPYYESGNQLVFYFENDLQAALDFVKQILEISSYHTEIIQVKPGIGPEQTEE